MYGPPNTQNMKGFTLFSRLFSLNHHLKGVRLSPGFMCPFSFLPAFFYAHSHCRAGGYGNVPEPVFLKPTSSVFGCKLRRILFFYLSILNDLDSLVIPFCFSNMSERNKLRHNGVF